MRRIHFLTAARSEYDLMSPVIRAAAADPRLDVAVVVTGAHLSPFHGLGIQQIEADGFRIAGRIETLLASESWSARALSFAQLTDGLTRLYTDQRPDILFVAGDREEALAGAMVANFLRVFVAHSHGGDRCIASDVDEVFRPAISKLAHFHFTATEGHRERLVKMGERPEHVFAVGAAGLDRLRNEPDRPLAEIQTELGVDANKPFFLVIQHPTSTLENSGRAGEEMRALLEGALSTGHPVLCSYPNFDPGNIAIRRTIDELRAHNPRLVAYHNLDRRTFVTLYRRCSAIVGNSSSLLVEAGFLHIPAILVGPRQEFRERGANVLRIEPTRDDVARACRRALEDEDFRQLVRAAPSLYGDGHTAPRIAAALATVELAPSTLNKVMTY